MSDVRCWQPRTHDAHDWSGNGDVTVYHCDGMPFTRRAVSPDAPAARLSDQAAQPGALTAAELATWDHHKDCDWSPDGPVPCLAPPDCNPHEHEFSYDDLGRMRCACGTFLFEHAPGHPYGSQPGPGGMYARWCLRDDCDWRQSGRIEMGALVATFLVCVIGISLFTLAVMGARTGLCKVDDTHSYCHASQR